MNVYRRVRCHVFSLFAFLLAGLAYANDEEAIREALFEELQHHPVEYLGLEWENADTSHVDELIAHVYHENALHPLWVTPSGPTSHAQGIYRTLLHAHSHGLDPAAYGVEKMSALGDSLVPADLARLDVLLTFGLIAYANDVHEGRLSPREDDPALFAHARDEELDPVGVVRSALLAENVEAFVDSLAPTNRHYVELRQKLTQHRDIASQGGWPRVPDGPVLHPGETDTRIALLAERLRISGDLQQQVPPGDVYGPVLVEAVKAFQFRHGIGTDGVIGANTLEQLNVPVDARIRQIEINLERWRWKLRDLGDDYILVDIAGFTLDGVKNGETVIEMPVIVGKHHHESPVFSDSIKYVEFNPFWNITPNIARNEMLPHLQKDPDYLGSKHIRLFSSWGEGARELDPRSIDWHGVSRRQMGQYKLRQDPGPWNALGTVKFVFPNKYSVYLHDTPNHNLFDKTDRAFSHGCVRVDDPAGLAVFILGGDAGGWDRNRVSEINRSGKRTVVGLDEPLPVHLAYRTAWVDQSGKMRFNKDVYGRDAKLLAALYSS